MSEDLLYEERVSSEWTTALFAAFSVVSILLLVWQLLQGGAGFLRGLLIFLVAFFLFSSLNYRTLRIRLSAQELKLRFGIFSWTVPVDNVAGVERDSLPWLMRNGGAGVHFMMIRGATACRSTFSSIHAWLSRCVRRWVRCGMCPSRHSVRKRLSSGFKTLRIYEHLHLTKNGFTDTQVQ